jgi:uncharacterized damage-inducible protein DinB
MADGSMKAYLHEYLKDVRQAVLDKVDGLSEYDARRPLTMTGTNLLGLVKHLSIWEARYFGAVFDRPFPEPLPRWDLESERLATMWATEHESRTDVIDRYRRAWEHGDATIAALALDAPGHVEWWSNPKVTLFDVLVHMIAETSRHAGHADILREEVDGAVGADAESMARKRHDAAFWAERRADLERVARAADLHAGP